VEENSPVAGGRTRLAIVLAAIALVAAMALSLVGFSVETTGRRGAAEQSVGQGDNRLTIAAQVLSVDPNRYEMNVRMDIQPARGLLNSDGLTLARELRMYVQTAAGSPERVFAANRPVGPIDATISLYDGDAAAFPFDVHQANVFLFVTDSSGTAVPVTFSMDAGAAGFAISAETAEDARAGAISVDLTVQRSATTVSFAIFVMVVQWLLALGLVGLLLSILFQGRKIELAMFTWMAGMLFAFPALRNAVPGSPPIGALYDYIALFWTQSIVAVCLLTIVFMWLRRPAK
jgi:HAMP domain-containing protein